MPLFAGRSFAVCATEGVTLFSLDHRNLFNPFELGVEVTPASIEDELKKGEYSAALKMALRLNQTNIIENVLLCTPVMQSSFTFWINFSFFLCFFGWKWLRFLFLKSNFWKNSLFTL